jgi:hypothetical protein
MMFSKQLILFKSYGKCNPIISGTGEWKISFKWWGKQLKIGYCHLKGLRNFTKTKLKLNLIHCKCKHLLVARNKNNLIF